MRRTTKRWLIPVVVMAVAVGMAAPAMGGVDCNKKPDHPVCAGDPGDPSGAVEVTIEPSLLWAQEASDTVVYRVTVKNDSTDDVLVASTLNGTLGTVPGDGLGSFAPVYPVAAHYDGLEVGADPVTLTNKVTATAGGEEVATASADVELHHDYEECVFTADLDDPQPGEEMASWACIWEPTGPGVWEVTVDPTPVASPRGVNNIQITLRDHIPGNWCPEGVNTKWRMGDPPVVATFTIPDWSTVPLGDPVCSIGGAGGDFFGVGTPGSFYLVASGYVTVSEVTNP